MSSNFNSAQKSYNQAQNLLLNLMKPSSYNRSNNPSAESKKHVVELLSMEGLSAERDKDDNQHS